MLAKHRISSIWVLLAEIDEIEFKRTAQFGSSLNSLKLPYSHSTHNENYMLNSVDNLLFDAKRKFGSRAYSFIRVSPMMYRHGALTERQRRLITNT